MSHISTKPLHAGKKNISDEKATKKVSKKLDSVEKDMKEHKAMIKTLGETRNQHRMALEKANGEVKEEDESSSDSDFSF